jgi:YidC/Oxa1 family membrane protein insertase
MSLAKNPVVRIVVPIVLLAGGVFIAFAVMRNSLSGPQQRANQAQPAPSTPSGPATPPAGASASPPAPSPGGAGPATPAPASTGAPAASNRPLRVRPWPDSAPRFDDLGSLDPKSDARMRLRFADIGAGLESLELTDHFQTVDPNSPNELLQKRERSRSSSIVQLVPFAANAVRIDGRAVNIAFIPGGKGSVWRQTAPGSFEAMIEDDTGASVARLTRAWKLAPGRYDLALEQKVENLTQAPLSVQWVQTGPTDLPAGIVRYGGDKRRVRFGYMLDPKADPAQESVLSPASRPGLYDHVQAMRGKNKGDDPATPFALWPTDETRASGLVLVWTAMTNRYFSVAVHRSSVGVSAPAQAGVTGSAGAAAPTAPAGPSPRRLEWTQVERVGIADGQEAPRPDLQAVLALVLTSDPQTIPAGASGDFSLGVYAGPTSDSYIAAEPTSAPLGLSKLVMYSFGGPCGLCAFQPVAQLLRYYLGGLHWLLGDWAVAIILLVVTIRTILHPVTKWSQVNIQRFSKQMSELAPKQKAVQEKFKNDPTKMREETARLMRESNVNYSGLLGCFPAFLQMPIWYSMSAVLFFTFEFRHSGAFFGVFQAIKPGWHFLADMGEPDHLFGLGAQYSIPFISNIMGPVDSFNALPVILGTVFYFHQKYLTPPPSAAMTPEQLQQQKIAKWIMVVMFPLGMYNAPAGLSLYFITNSLLAIGESHYIRKHVKELDAKAAAEGRKPWEKARAGGKPQPWAGAAKAKKLGFLARLSERVEQQRKLMEEMKAQQMKKDRQQRTKGK